MTSSAPLPERRTRSGRGGRAAPYPRATSVLVALAAAVVVAAGMSGIRGILAPTLLSLVLVICASPLRGRLQRVGVPQGLATGSVILVMFALIAAFSYAVIIAFAQFVAMLPDYADQFAQIGSQISSALMRIGIGQEQIDSMVGDVSAGNLAATVTGALGSVASITGALVILLTMMILMAADAVFTPPILRHLDERQPLLVVALGEYATNVRRYMVVTTLLGVVQGVLNTIALWLLGVPAALLWGLLAFVCSFIPNVGYFVAIIPPLIFGFLVGGWPIVGAIVLVYGGINAVVQSIVQPRVVGHAVSLSQTVTFFSVLFWAVIIGPIGAILAIPLTLLVKTVLVDADPRAQWWRPVFGPTAETRDVLKAEKAAAKQARDVKRSHAPKAPKAPEAPKTPKTPQPSN
ncbi:MAG: AI-2E family transporter [Microbacteriaceae bacterium]